MPVRPGAYAGRETATRAAGRDAPAPVWIGAALVLLGVIAVLVFVALPRWVAAPAGDRSAAAAGAHVPTETAPPPEPRLSEEELAALREQADRLLAELLTQQQRLAALSAESWGGEAWGRYQALGRAGDDAYLAGALPETLGAYEDALALGERMIGRSAEIIERALDAGQRALEAGNVRLAIEQFDLVLRIDPEREAAAAGRARAERLPEALALSGEADALRQQGRLKEAAETYRAALAIDGAWAPARTALEEVERRIVEAEFGARMSMGMQALAGERYGDAEREFRAALAMRPGSAEARDGIVQAEQGMKLDQIALAEARALAFERRELWAQAIAQYEDALATDGSLAFAKSGLARARSRADLDAKLSHLIDHPGLLFGDDGLAGARRLVEEAAAVVSAADGGTARLEEQIARLDRLIVLASTPVPVELHSDGLTEVTLYRVGRLGTFSSKAVPLKPGRYTVIGSRVGYRDVRKTFTVLPGEEVEPVRVICVEPI